MCRSKSIISIPDLIIIFIIRVNLIVVTMKVYSIVVVLSTTITIRLISASIFRILFFDKSTQWAIISLNSLELWFWNISSVDFIFVKWH